VICHPSACRVWRRRRTPSPKYNPPLHSPPPTWLLRLLPVPCYFLRSILVKFYLTLWPHALPLGAMDLSGVIFCCLGFRGRWGPTLPLPRHPQPLGVATTRHLTLAHPLLSLSVLLLRSSASQLLYRRFDRRGVATPPTHPGDDTLLRRAGQTPVIDPPEKPPSWIRPLNLDRSKSRRF